jgi:site-specific recombinase XerD
MDTSALGQLEREYARYLSQERGLSEASLANYVPLVHRFLTDRFGHGPLRLDQLQLHDVTDYVLQQATVFRSRRSQLLVSALRSFFRFLRQRGEIELDLAAAVPTVAHWRLSSLPKYLPPEQIEQILQSCDQRTVVGQRDYTVLLLLARLGLRAGEIVHLCLEDLDWDAGLLTVRGKGGQAARLPLPTEVGSALARYLRDGRPRCSTRRVFIRMKAPHSGFASSVAIDSLLRRALKRANLLPAFKGSHLLRHSLATRMLRNGASMAEIGQLLRHRQAQTTEIYAKVDPTALGALAQPWPGGAL